MTDRKCGGQCCENFYLPRPAEFYWESYEKWLNEGKKEFEDIDIIGPMIIPLYPVDPKKPEGEWRYTCKHWDKETTLCKIYDKRPQMCKDYPYASPCTFCSWTNQEFIDEREKNLKPAGGMSFPK